MLTRIEKLTFDLKESFAGNPWYGDAVMKKIGAINPEEANARLHPSFHSIAMIIQHMVSWRTFAIKKMRGETSFDIQQDDQNDWSEIQIGSRGDWDTLIGRLISSQEQILELIASREEGFLDRNVPGRPYDFGYLLEGIVQHDIYHLGQIALIHLWGK